MITEDQFEQLAIQWFQDTRWDYVNGKVISLEGEAPERESGWNLVATIVSPLQGFRKFWTLIPRAMPWAIAFSPVGARNICGTWRFPRAMPRAIAFSPVGARNICGTWRFPRAMPWAIAFSPLGADGISSAPTGQTETALGNHSPKSYQP